MMCRHENQKPIDTTSTAKKPKYVDVSPIQSRLFDLRLAGKQDSDEYHKLSEELKACDVVPLAPHNDKY